MFEILKNKSFRVIARRYFVLNGFDGILTVLGITAGSFSAGVMQPYVLITSGLGAAIALGISGISGAYITEKAERLRKFKDLQEAMLCEMENSVQKENVEKHSIAISLINGASPFFCASLSIVPYLMAHLGLLTMNSAYMFSAGISIALMGILGGFLGKISRENIPIYALKMIGVGLVTAALSTVLGLGA